MFDDTIAAIATPIGEGGLAVIRISGADALSVADRCFVPVGKNSSKPSVAPTHTVHYGKIILRNKPVDEVLVTVMRAPRTYTREDVVEITCHGGLLSAKLVLDAALSCGARLAQPGEFTRRAFLNGRLDLAQAEAVADVIHSRTELALSAANEQLAGSLSKKINQLRDDLLNVLAHVEAHIDFPEEDIAPDTREALFQKLNSVLTFIERVLKTADEGQILRRGIRAAIVGRPNAGKSSLLNQLLGRDRAIVSPIAGTTRDTIEETANVRGLPVVFIDTAGLRAARDEIESEGIRRSHESLNRAELILHVVDVSDAETAEADDEFPTPVGKKKIIVRNKIDRVRGKKFPVSEILAVEVCCLTGEGIEVLKDAIKETVWSGEIRAEMLEVMINSRHQDALARAADGVRRTLEALKSDASLELIALDLRVAVNAVGEVVGKTATEDLLDSIFSQFCIGK